MKVISHFLLDAEDLEKSSTFYLYSGHRINEFGARNKSSSTLYLFLPIDDNNYKLYLLVDYDTTTFHFLVDTEIYDKGDVESYQRIKREIFLNQDFDCQKVQGHVEYTGNPKNPTEIEVEQVSTIMMQPKVILTKVGENKYTSPASQWNYRKASGGSNRVQI